MSDINNLREVSDQILHGLTADEALKQRILEKTAGSSKVSRFPVFRPLPVFCCVMVLLLTAAAALHSLQPVNPAETVEMNVFAAGNKETVPPEDGLTGETAFILNGIEPDEVVAVELSGFDTIDNPEVCHSLISILIEEAIPAEEIQMDFDHQLMIRTINGSEIVYDTAAPYIFGNRCWLCPSFFSLMNEILNE